MIYIIYAVQAPFKICGCACKGVCDVVNDICASIGDACSKPLGGYVLATFATMASVMALLGLAVSKLPGNFDYSDDCGKVQIFSAANFFFAWLHCASAVYIQWALIKKIREIASEQGLDEDDVKQEDVTAAARFVFLNDFYFCFYFFAAAGIFAYNCSNISNLAGCLHDGPVWSASALMIAFGFLSANYAFCWYIGKCCFAKANKSKKKVQRALTKPVAPIIGVAAPSVATQQPHLVV